jgi:hypothetical protein
MQSDSPSNSAKYRGDDDSVTTPDRPSSVSEWIDIGRQIEQQIRRDVARVVGAEQTEGWGDVRDTVAGRIRERAAGVDTGEIGQRAERIARDAEEHLRSILAQTIGAGQDADWAAIGRTVTERLRQTLDPHQAIGPGGSGTAASAEDASVPAAPPSPDLPPRSARTGGDDTGLPTVTDEVGEPPRRAPLTPS